MTSGKKTALTLPELREALQRQEHLLNNKAFINKLPDKGEKIKKHRDKLLIEMARTDKIEESCKLLSALSIQPSKSEIQNLEWRNHRNQNGTECLDSDDDSDPEDPLAVIASSTDVTKKIIHIPPEEKLITEKDVKEIEEFSLDRPNCEFNQHTKYICDKTDKSNLVIRESYKPYKTTKTNVHDANKEILHKRGKHWEVTSATPPPIIHGPIREISIQESLQLQSTQNQQLKDIQMKQASEKLTKLLGTNVDADILSSFANEPYRESTEIQCNSDDESDQEVYDEEPGDGGVIFPIVN
ncbi:RNA polymerase II subunit M [Arctopsyche grandis]|uniref:RNA polymerase II subunit M n=1 Tax=Arctopsyche grandis TaxID=121162 RepID=UPI00406D977F